MTLLQKAHKYNIHSKQKNWLQNLALEAETAITQLPTTDRDVYRKLVAERINTLQRNCNPNPRRNTHPESRTIKTIQAKLQENNAIITRADKGNSLVILPSQQYKSKVHNFLQANRFQTTSTDPTKTYQNLIGKTINDSKTLIPQDSRWRYINLNPSAPTIKGLMKIHKPDQPIVNWHNAPVYKLAKLFTQRIGHLAALPCTYNIENSKDLIQKLRHPNSTPLCVCIIGHHQLIPKHPSHRN